MKRQKSRSEAIKWTREAKMMIPSKMVISLRRRTGSFVLLVGGVVVILVLHGKPLILLSMREQLALVGHLVCGCRRGLRA